MTHPIHTPSDVAFTDTVKAVQTRKGSRAAYARMERAGGFASAIDADMAAFIAQQSSFFMATANAQGQPYIQHRGGPPGFLQVRDEHTLAFADFRGNRQYISVGNLEENPKVCLFLIDYAQRQRVKIWGLARTIENNSALLDELMPVGYDARPERAIVIEVSAWDANCPQHIPRKVDASDAAQLLATRDARIAELEAELARLGKRAT
jgi:hypothetical protein